MGGIILILFWNCFRGKVQVHCALSIFIISTFDAHTYLNCVSAYNPASEFMYFISYHNLNEKGIFLLLKFINSTTDLFYNLIYLSHSFCYLHSNALSRITSCRLKRKGRQHSN